MINDLQNGITTTMAIAATS